MDSANDLQDDNLIVQFGLPPHRIDLLSSISALDFTQAGKEKVTEKIKIGRAS